MLEKETELASAKKELAELEQYQVGYCSKCIKIKTRSSPAFAIAYYSTMIDDITSCGLACTFCGLNIQNNYSIHAL